MKKHIHKLVVSLLIATTVLSMTACSSNTNSEESTIQQDVPMGRYVETSLEMPKNVKSLIDYKVISDGTIELYGYNNQDKAVGYTSKDGQNWEPKKVDWLNELISKGNRLSHVAYSQENEKYVLYFDEAYTVHLGKVVEDTKIEEIPYQLEGSNSITNMQVAPNGDLLIGMQYNGVTRVSSVDGSVITEYTSMGAEGEFAITDEQVMILDMQRNGIIIFNLETGSEENFIPYEGTLWGSKLLSNSEGSLYIVNTDGVSRLAPGGSVWETVIDGQMSSFGMPSLYMREVDLKDDDEFVVLLNDQTEGYVFAKYAFDPNTPARPTTEITLYMLEDSMTIRQAIAEYQRQNQEVVINIQVGIEKGDSITKTDAIRTLNTQLLAGKGPDILLLDGLPMKSYMDKGVLLDMSEWANTMMDQGEWLENITGAYKREDGSIYAIPTRFTIPTMWGNKEIIDEVDSLPEFADWAKNNPDKQALYSMTPEQLIEKFYSITAHTWLNEDGQIKEDTFVTFLESINALAEKEIAAEKDEYVVNTLSTEYMAHKDTELHLEDISSFGKIAYYNSAIMQRGEGDFGLALAGEGGVFKPQSIIGINANSTHQDIAKAIVEMALSEQVQKVDLGDGLAVQKKIFEEQATLDKNSTNMFAMPMALEKPINMQPATQESYTQLKKQVDKLTIPAMTDEVLMNLIIEETKGYFDGEKTAKEAAAAAAKRTRAYLAE